MFSILKIRMRLLFHIINFKSPIAKLVKYRNPIHEAKAYTAQPSDVNQIIEIETHHEGNNIKFIVINVYMGISKRKHLEREID